MAKLIRWISPITGEADLQRVRDLYSNPLACRPRDNGLMDPEPKEGHVHFIGTEKEPIIISQIDYSRSKVIFIRMPKRSAKALHDGNCEVKESGIAIPNKDRNVSGFTLEFYENLQRKTGFELLRRNGLGDR